MNNIAMLLKMIHNRMETGRNRLMREFGLSGSQFELLVFLNHCGGQPVSQKEISEHLHIRHSSTIDVLKHLEAKGLVTREVNEKNAKFRDVSLTEEGIALMELLRGKKDELDAAIYGTFTAGELETLSDMLGVVYDNIVRFDEQVQARQLELKSKEDNE